MEQMIDLDVIINKLFFFCLSLWKVDGLYYIKSIVYACEKSNFILESYTSGRE